jgi:hypothetical protein
MMVEFAFPILPSQTLHPYNPYRRLRARPQRHLTMVWPPSFTEITTVDRRHSPWIFPRLLPKCPKSQAGKPSRWQARHQTSQPSRVLCEKQLQHEPILFWLFLVAVRYTFYLYIYFFLFAKWLFTCSLIASISACHPERCLPVAGRFITCTHRHCIHSYLHGVLFSRLTRAFD